MSSKIEWTEDTWNPVVGCDKVSAGCKNCYAIKHAFRLMHMPATKEKYAGTVEKTANGMNWTGRINLDEKALLKPLQTKKPTTYFVNSMSDLFHEGVDLGFVVKVFAVMFLTPHHTYQILTKRARRMANFLNREEFLILLHEQVNIMHHEYIKPLEQELYTYPEVQSLYPLKNVWLGVSVEHQKAADERIPYLLQVPAVVRWLSCEPLLGGVDLRKAGCFEPNMPSSYIDWVVVGGESGHDARPMHPDWARSLRDQCHAAGVPFFFKQWGEYYTKRFNGSEPAFMMFRDKMHWINKASTWVQGGKCVSIDGRQCNIGKDFGECEYPVAIMDKVGKKASGRMLDGVLHDEYPQPTSIPPVPQKGS